MTLAIDVLLGFYQYLLPFAIYSLCGFVTFIYAGHRLYIGGRRGTDSKGGKDEEPDSEFFYQRLRKSVVSPASWVYVILWLSACGTFAYANWRILFLPAVLATDMGQGAAWVGLGHLVLTISSTLAIFYWENLTVGFILYTLFTLGTYVTQMGLVAKLHVDGTAELWAPIFTFAWASLVGLMGFIYLIILIAKNMKVACGDDKYESVDSEM
jgi:hypothetical protein